MNCPGCDRDHIEHNLGFMACPDDVIWWPTCEGCGYPSFRSMFGVRLPPEGPPSFFDEHGFLMADGPMTYREPGVYR